MHGGTESLSGCSRGVGREIRQWVSRGVYSCTREYQGRSRGVRVNTAGCQGCVVMRRRVFLVVV